MQGFAEGYRVVETAIAERAFPGCAFGVLSCGQIVFEGAAGHFTYERDAPKVTASTVYDLASVTKVVATTAMAMLLFQRGKLDVDTRLGDVLPAFVVGRAAADPAHRITLRHLLAHSSGLPGYVKFFEFTSSRQELLHACMRLSVEAEPGTRAEYSDPGFILLGRALEAIAGEDLDSFVRREILHPLGMNATCYCPAPAIREAIPPTEIDAVYRHRLIQGEVQDENAWALGGIAGHAGLFSNVHDLLLFAQSIVSAGNDNNSPATAAPLFEPVTIETFCQRQPPAGSSRALGWDTPSENSSSGRYFAPRSIGHLGYSGCSLWIDLETSLAIVLLTNRTWPHRESQLIKQFRPAFHNAVREALK